jgi:uncharacterized protein
VSAEPERRRVDGAAAETPREAPVRAAPEARTPASAATLGGIGFAAGLLSGLLGVGGGFILVPLQVMLAKTGQHEAHGTSLAAIIPGSLVALAVYWFGLRQPQVDLPLAALLTAGSVVGVYLGARSIRLVPERALKLGVAVVLFGLGLKEILAP